MSRIVTSMALAVTLASVSNDANAQDRFFNSNGLRIRYVEQGAGEPVVLVHGQGSFIEENWRHSGVIDALSHRYRVIALDQRGYGKSDKPHEPSAYGSHMGDDIVRLLDHLGIRRAHVVGSSMGARVTSWLIVNRPQRLLTATLGGSTYYVDTPEQRRRFEELAIRIQSGLPFDAIKQSNPGWTDAQTAAYIAKYEGMNDFRALSANYRGTPGLFITEAALSATKVPVLHVVGSLDANMPASRRLKDTVLPSVELVIVPNATHIEAVRRTEFVEAVERFLARHRQTP